MKHRLFILLVILAIAPMAIAQKYACVNTDYVLKSLPDYANAQKRLDRYVADWQKELTDKASELTAMRAEYEQESYLLPENLKKRRQEEIRAKEQEIRDLQQQHFGAGGDLERHRAELLKPIQDRVYSIIERIASEKNYAFVFDKSGSPTVLYANKKYDISDDVLEQLGVKPGSATASPSSSEKANSSTDKKGLGKELGKGLSPLKDGKEFKKPTNPEMRDASSKSPSRNVQTPLGSSRIDAKKR